jgi:ATP/maltotriose-dependent transcriptional regulator MalT/DNA-binding SARP family transcriptional activator
MSTTGNIPISLTKVIIPRRRDEILTRPRLLEMMFEFLDKKLVLVSAPAGYGKTSMLIDLCYQSELPFCWLSLDALDQEPQRFLAYFIEALAQRFPGFGGESREVLSNVKTLDGELERIIISLANEAYEHIPEHFVLVLDDYHLVGDVPAIRDFINRFVQLVDENCHLVLSSRMLVDLPDLPLLVARDQVGGLDLTELAFRPEEIQALLAQNYNLHVPDETAQELAAESEGWITGLQLSSLGIVQGMASRLKVARAAGVDLFDYLGQQVLDQQPQPIRLFLLRSSLLEEFDAALCESALRSLYAEPQNWHALIHTILQNNLFSLPVGNESGWIRYHHLFRDFLQARLAHERPEEVVPILQGLALAYEARGEWERAYHVQKRLGNMDMLASLVERAALHLMSRALVTLDSWLGDLPPSILHSRPGILSIRGTVAYVKGNLSDGLEMLNRAESIFRETGDSSGLALTLVRRATAHRFAGDYKAALHDAEEAAQLTAASDELHLIHADALRQKGLALFHQGRSRQAVKILEQALDIYTHSNDTVHIPILMMETGMAYRAVGKDEKTMRLYNQALHIWKEEGNLSWQATLLNNLGVLYFLRGEYEKAVLSLEDGLACAQHTNSVRMEGLLLTSLGDVYAEVGDASLAQQGYQRAEALAQEADERFLAGYLNLTQASLALQQGDIAQARRRLAAVDTEDVAENSIYEYGLFNLILGQLYLQEEKLAQAVASLERAKACFADDGRQLECAQSQVWLAAAYYRSGERASARQAMKEYSNTAGPKPAHSILVVVQRARVWLDGLQTDPEIGNLLRVLLDQAGQAASQLPAARRQLRRLTRSVQAPTAGLSIQALGAARVSVAGKSLTLAEWQTQSVRDLFFYFLTLPEPASKEQIGMALWPEVEEPARLRLRFKNEIYRLRRAVGKDVIVLFENEQYGFNRNLDYEYDVEAFDAYLKQAQASDDEERQITFYRKATGLVRGTFLEDVDAVWAWPERERRNQVFLSALLTLVELFEKKDRLQEALAACQRAIEFDPVFENAYREAMQIEAQSKNRAGVIRLYEAYRSAMQRELDLPPTPEMQALYERLIR